MKNGLPILLLALVVTMLPGSARARALTPRTPVTVVLDDNYPPYIFRDADGHLQGILPDQWALWERKTGVKADLQAMDWSEAQRVMREGRADVIDTIFRTPEREQLYDFTPPYAQIEVPVFADKDLGGITDVSSLQGFTVGVKAGDAVIENLTNHGIHSLKEYPSYEAIIQAAKNEEIKVFSVDQPAAIYYLYKYGVADEFRRSFVLYTGEFHRAVQKDRSDLLALVENGFRKISPREHRTIEQKWMGTPFLLRTALREWAPWLMLVATVLLLLAIVNVVLRRQVHARTAELRRTLETLRQSLEERKQAEAKLRASHEYFAGMFNAINDGLQVLDIQTGRLLDVNQRMCELFGYSREEALAGGIGLLFADAPPYALKDAERWLQKARTEGPQIFEWMAKHRDGHLFWVEVNLREVKLGPDDRLIVTVRDITDRKAAEEERLRFDRQIQESQKLESLGLLAGGIAHDFNNLLTAILGNIDLALLDIPRASTARDDLLTAMSATRRAAELAQQMLAYSGKGRFVIERVDVPAAIREIVQMLKASISKSADLRIRFPETLPEIEVDATQLRQVIMNLVINASEALENQPGTIDISASVVEGQAAPAFQLWPHRPLPPGSYLRIEVADSGIGMPPDVLDKIFDPFFSTKFIGRGLGLPAVLGIVRGHKGAIQVDSIPGKGTTFRVFFPASPARASDASAPAPAPAARTEAGLILLVDDEPGVRETASKLLARLGFQVLCAADGGQAIALFRGQAPRISGVILDLTMPNLDGVQTLAELRLIRADIPVIISSGYSEQDVLHRFAGMQLSGFIPKPYTLDGLRTALARSLPT